MKGVAKAIVYVAAAFGLFVCFAIGEAWVRKRHTAALPILGIPIKGASISASSMPDFLWSGRAWWIEIETDKPLVLTLDEWTGRIPAGSHRIYSNHDHTNTGKFGDRDFWGFPDTVSISAAVP